MKFFYVRDPKRDIQLQSEKVVLPLPRCTDKLNERTKELHCLYRTFRTFLKGILDIFPDPLGFFRTTFLLPTPTVQ